MAPNNANCVGETLEDVYAVIRSLVIIKKQWTTLKEINSEYMNMEGQNIPFSDYGFNNPYDMLHRSGQFNLTRQPNGQVRTVDLDYPVMRLNLLLRFLCDYCLKSNPIVIGASFCPATYHQHNN